MPAIHCLTQIIKILRSRIGVNTRDVSRVSGGERIRLSKRRLATVAATAVLLASIVLVWAMIGGDDKPDITTDIPEQPDLNPDDGTDGGDSGDDGTDGGDQSTDDGDDQSDSGDDDTTGDDTGDEDQGDDERYREAEEQREAGEEEGIAPGLPEGRVLRGQR